MGMVKLTDRTVKTAPTGRHMDGTVRGLSYLVKPTSGHDADGRAAKDRPRRSHRARLPLDAPRFCPLRTAALSGGQYHGPHRRRGRGAGGPCRAGAGHDRRCGHSWNHTIYALTSRPGSDVWQAEPLATRRDSGPYSPERKP